jgi:radical SAM protein with 4Fe4S-binding SPASM domain
MRLSTLAQAAVRHGTHAMSETLYLKLGVDNTKPFAIQGLVNERCNYKCLYCDCWRKSDYLEMTIPEWREALLSLKDFVGPYVIQFGGGEPFVKRGFVDLVRFCHEQGIDWGVITNGSAFSRSVVEAVVDSDPRNIDISVDAASAAVHDDVRGTPGSLAKITEGIGLLLQQCESVGRKFPIRIKPTVHLRNFRLLPDLVEWTINVGATTVDFSPVRPWTPEVESELWIAQPADLETLEKVVERLIAMKKEGAPIETSEAKLRSFPDHFARKPVLHGVSPCRVGLRDYHIRPNGDVSMCWFYPPIGNVKLNSAREIWYGAEASRLRAKMVVCTKFKSVDCANSCLAHRTFVQEVQRALLMLRRV